MRTYQCLHDSIRRCSPIGTLQALRIKGSITPTVERICKFPSTMPFALSMITQTGRCLLPICYRQCLFLA